MEQFSPEDLRLKFIELLDSKRGTQAKLAKSIGKKASFFTHIRDGHAVNAMHLKAVGIVFGGGTVLNLLDVQNNSESETKLDPINVCLAEIKTNNPKIYEKVETYIAGAYDAAKAMDSEAWKVFSSKKVVQETEADGTNG
ncbi:MAG: hypothetical protein OCC45_10425 [Desulfotalea sp.]